VLTEAQLARQQRRIEGERKRQLDLAARQAAGVVRQKPSRKERLEKHHKRFARGVPIGNVPFDRCVRDKRPEVVHGERESEATEAPRETDNAAHGEAGSL
jgi:hypothetical protein